MSIFYLPVLISPQTLHNRLGIPMPESSVVCCCIFKGAPGRRLVFAKNSLFTICSSSFDGRFNLEQIL
jgi:hypothetical protein